MQPTSKTTIDLGMPAVERPEKSENERMTRVPSSKLALPMRATANQPTRNTIPQSTESNFQTQCPKAPPYIRQDTDVMSTRSGAIVGVRWRRRPIPKIYDWSDEEDLVERTGKIQQKAQLEERNPGVGSNKVINLLSCYVFRLTLNTGSFPSSFLPSSALSSLHAFSSRLHFSSTSTGTKPHPTEYRTYVKDNIEAWLFWTAANLVISWGLAMIIDLFPVVLRYFIAAIWGHV